MKGIISWVGSVLSFDWIETYFIKKYLTGIVNAAGGLIVTWAGKLSLAHYGVVIDGSALNAALMTLGTGLVASIINALKHSGDIVPPAPPAAPAGSPAPKIIVDTTGGIGVRN